MTTFCLALETSTRSMSVAVVSDERVLAARTAPAGGPASAHLVPVIHEVVRMAGLTFEQIHLVAVSQGPGSFTGLRIGITTVKGLVMVKRRPVVAIPTLDLLAQGGCEVIPQGRVEWICPVIDAKRGHVYTACYTWRDHTATRDSAYRLMPADELPAQLSAPVLLLGDGLSLYQEAWTTALGARARVAPATVWAPDVRVLGRMALERWRQGQVDDPLTLTPLYLYASDCQVTQKPAPIGLAS